MGQNRSDTPVQRAAKHRTAERNRCPACGRGSALRRNSDSWTESDGTEIRITTVECRWVDRNLCDYRNTTERRTPA